MPRNHAIIAADLAGKLKRLRIECEKCNRHGSYRVALLDPDLSLVEFKAELTAECPRRIAAKFNDMCGARFPDLPKACK